MFPCKLFFLPLLRKRLNDCVNCSGEWPQAKELLGEVTYMMPEDKPTKVLLRVMGEYGFNAPADWKGFRALTSK